MTALPWRLDAELPCRLAHRAGEVRAGRRLAELDAILDTVAGDCLAGDEAPAVGRVLGHIAVELSVGWLARPFGVVQHFSVRTAADLLRIALARVSFGQVTDVGGRHLAATHFDPWFGLVRPRARRRGDRRLGRDDD